MKLWRKPKRDTWRYWFKGSMSVDDINGTLLTAVAAAEGLYGQARTRMDVHYTFDPALMAFSVDASTDAGLDVCLMFAGIAIREYGELAFTVEHVGNEESK